MVVIGVSKDEQKAMCLLDGHCMERGSDGPEPSLRTSSQVIQIEVIKARVRNTIAYFSAYVLRLTNVP